MTDDTTTHDLGGAYSEQMYKAATVKADESQQLQDEKFGDARGKAIKPPFPPNQLAKLIEINVTHAKCGFSKARNVAGYGLEIVPHPEVEEPDESQRSTAEEFWFGNESTWQVGPMESERATPADVLEMAWADYEFIGWFAIEALTSMDGTPTGLAYIPAPTIRKRREAPGFVHIKNEKLRYYGAFGDRYLDEDGNGERTFVDSETGESGSSVTGDVANEIIWKRNHTPFVDHYGTPDVIPAIPNIEGDQEAREFNIDFFEHDGVPRLAVIVEGGQLTEGAREDIRKVMRGMKEEKHRTMILEVEKLLDSANAVDLGDDDDLRIRVEPLTVGIDEDASFLGYHSHNEHEILKAHEVPPIEAGTIESGSFSTDAEAQRKGYLETTIGPKQGALSQLLYETVHAALGITDYTIELKQRGVDTRLMDAEALRTEVQASQGTMKVDELRDRMGLEPLGPPVGEMLLAELGGMGQPMAGIDQSVEDLVNSRVQEAAEDLRRDVVTEQRVQNMIEADD